MANHQCLTQEKEDLLREKTPELMKWVTTSKYFWAVMAKYDVLTQNEISRLQSQYPAPADQIAALTEKLRKGTNGHYAGFLQTLRETDQGAVVTDILGEDPSSDKEQMMLSPEKKETLKQKGPQLIQKIKPNEELWTSLIYCGAVTDFDASNMKSGNKSDPDQVSLLLEHVHRGSRSRYATFITALMDTHHEYVVTEVLQEEAEHHDICCTKEMSIQKRIWRNRDDIKKLKVDIFQHLLIPVLEEKKARVITTEPNSLKKAESLTTFLLEATTEECEQFCTLIAGLYPDLFLKLMLREPTSEESDHCVYQLSTQLRKKIEKIGHRPDLATDDKIDLEHQFVKIRLTSADLDATNTECSAEAQDDTLPDHYQKTLQDIDDTLEYKDILTKTDTGSMILLQGRAGIGKTTLTQFLLYQWFRGNWAPHFICTFMLNLRLLMRTTTKMTLTELLTTYGLYTVPNEHPQIITWMQNRPAAILLFLDGIDELAELCQLLTETTHINDLRQEFTPLEWCINILRRNILPQATIIMSSRPFSALKSLEPEKVIELMGLTQKRVLEFIQKNVPEQKREHVKGMLVKNPMLMSVCGITFYAAILCKVLQEVEDTMEDLITYTRISCFIIMRSASRRIPGMSDPDPMKLAQLLKPSLPHLARLAKRGLLSDTDLPRLVFDQGDITKLGITAKQQKAIEDSGLITTKSYHHEVFYEFLHLSVQELLAMAGLLNSDTQTVHDMLPKMSRSGRFNMAQLFLAGISQDSQSQWIQALKEAIQQNKDAGKEAEPERSLKQRAMVFLGKMGTSPEHESRKHLKMRIKRTRRSKESGLLQGLQGCYESQSEELAKEIAKKLIKKEGMELKYMPLTAVDISALTFVMKHVPKLKRIELLRVNMDDFSASVLATFLRNNSTIEDVSLGENQITDVGAESIASALKVNNTLHYLNLEDNDMTDNGVLALVEVVYNCQHEIKIRVSNRTSLVNKDLGQILRGQRPSVLRLYGSGLTHKGAAHLAEVLKMEDCNIKELDLAINQITDVGAESIASGLKANNTLQTLNLDVNQITDVGAESIASALKANNTLQTLDLWENQITDVGAESIASGLKANNTLQHLFLWENQITDVGAESIASGLKANNTLQTLSLGSNQITDVGAESIASALKANNTLQTLDLQGNMISPAGEETLKKAKGPGLDIMFEWGIQ